MKSEQWQRIKEIVPAARRLAPEARVAYLNEACAGDPELRNEVDSFLAADLESVDFLKRAPLELLGEIEGALKENSQVGAYRIRRALGRGGMGVVYLAARTDEEFTRQVAIKVLHPGLQSEEANRRFRQEIQILANLNHPNIAQFHEGGRTEDGRLYYLMEYVEGEPIDAYCRGHELALEERVQLFRKVCSALQYAHRNLVVHRDLKPGNILVTEGGEPKLLDFGVAKLLAAPGVSSAALTGVDQKLFTPDYASPEQLTGETITTASDVYSLGVLLYELLVGERPYRLKSHLEEEVRRVVCEETPPPPSAASSRKVRVTSVETAPVPEPASKFHHQLAGDLDTIVLKALRKEQDRRYASAEQLSDDMDRFLQGLPVLAQKDTVLYRARKFIQRNRGAVATFAAFILLFVGFILLSLHQAERVARERDRTQDVSSFLVSLFEASESTQKPGKQVTVRELLDSGAARLRGDLEGQPQARAALLTTMGRAYQDLGLNEAARPLFEESLALRRQVSGPESVEAAQSHTALGVLLRQAGWAEEAEPHLRVALEIKTARLGTEHPDVGKALDNLSKVLKDMGRLKEAADLQSKSAEIRKNYVAP